MDLKGISLDDLYELRDQINRKIWAIEARRQARIEAKMRYDDNRSYRTGERQLDTRIDGTNVRGRAALQYKISWLFLRVIFHTCRLHPVFLGGVFLIIYIRKI